MPNVNSLHRRLDRLGANHGASFAEAMEHATERTRPDRPWTAAGHPGVPPNKPIPPLSPDPPTHAGECGAWWPRAGRARSMGPLRHRPSPAWRASTSCRTAVRADRTVGGQRKRSTSGNAELWEERSRWSLSCGDCRRASPSTDGTANTYSLAARLALARVPNCFAQPSHSLRTARTLRGTSRIFLCSNGTPRLDHMTSDQPRPWIPLPWLTAGWRVGCQLGGRHHQ